MTLLTPHLSARPYAWPSLTFLVWPQLGMPARLALQRLLQDAHAFSQASPHPFSLGSRWTLTSTHHTVHAPHCQHESQTSQANRLNAQGFSGAVSVTGTWGLCLEPGSSCPSSLLGCQPLTWPF